MIQRSFLIDTGRGVREWAGGEGAWILVPATASGNRAAPSALAEDSSADARAVLFLVLRRRTPRP